MHDIGIDAGRVVRAGSPDQCRGEKGCQSAYQTGLRFWSSDRSEWVSEARRVQLTCIGNMANRYNQAAGSSALIRAPSFQPCRLAPATTHVHSICPEVRTLDSHGRGPVPLLTPDSQSTGSTNIGRHVGLRVEQNADLSEWKR